jgi:hypothetical protein
MAVELAGTVRMRDDSDETHVRVEVEGETLRLKTGDSVLGEWPANAIGVQSLNEGFVLRAEGEEFLLITEDDVAFAEAMDLKAVSPRLAKQVAARHRPEESPLPPEPEAEPSRVGPIAFALSGALIVVGATVLGSGDASVARGQAEVAGGLEFWMAFTIGGVLMIATAYVLAVGARWGRLAAILSLLVVTVIFGLAVSDTPTDATHLTAYGFLAGGLVIGVAVLFGGLLEDRR